MITLLTDFGTADYFVPAVKGVILSINPATQIIDLTHEIPAQDIAAGAFTFGACYHHFPAGTVHVAVVDPGVGSARRPIIVRAGERLCVGPDNGLFGYVYKRESQVEVFQIERAEYFRHPVSSTFHGRDVFAPVAAWLSRGVQPEAFGREIEDYVRLESNPERGTDFSLFLQPAQTEISPTPGKCIFGVVIHIDRFGNCITNLTERELPNPAVAARLLLAGKEVMQFGSHFAQANRKDQLFAYLGSAGFWEIALWCDSASARLDIQRGAEVILELR